jgi:hypothetical protein
MKIPALLLWLAALCLSGCASGQSEARLPYGSWGIAVFAPEHMEVWIESVDVIDKRGLVFERVYGGVGSIGNPPHKNGHPTGWQKNPGGSSKSISGVDLPKTLYVRWQSLVEPQTYNVRIDVPEWVREAMVTKKQPVCPWKSDWGKNLPSFGYSDHITIGLAPGGIAKVWLQGPCLAPVEIGRFEGKVNKAGPYDGTSGGKHRPLSEASKAYIEQFGIPYGSW